MNATTADPIQLVLDKLEGVKAEGQGQWIARCPAHEDRVQSLSIGIGNDERVLLHCHAGCKTPTIVEAMDLKVTDLFVRASTLTSNGQRRIVESYNYVDTFGVLLYQVVRYEPKDFRQRRPDGKGGWIWNLKDIQRFPYRLQELMQSPDQCVVYIVEGERDVNRLYSEGMMATCNSGGAGKWSKIDDSALHNRHVIIIPDYDTPGRNHAEDVAQRLHGKAASVKIVELPRLAERGDISDWLDAGNDVETLDELAAKVTVWTELESNVNDDDTFRPDAKVKPDFTPQRLCLTNLEDVETQELEWTWPNRFPRGKLCLVVGEQGLGKSFLTLDMAKHISLGLSWPDCKDIDNPVGNVIVLAAEDGIADTVVPRLKWSGADLTKIKAIEGVREVDHEGKRLFDLQQDERLLRQAVEDIGNVRLIIIDPLDSYLGQDVNPNKVTDIRRVLTPLTEFAEDTGITIIGVCHLNKNEAQKAIYRVCGSVAYTSVARAVWLVTEDPQGEPKDRLLLKMKFNLAEAANGLSWTLDEGRVWWNDRTVDVTADDVLSDAMRNDEDEGTSALDEAINFLKVSLSKGPQRTKDVEKWAKEAGIAKSTLKRARKNLGIVAKPEFTGNAPDAWFLSLKEQGDQDPQDNNHEPDDPDDPEPPQEQGDHMDQGDHTYGFRDSMNQLPLDVDNAGSCDKRNLPA